MKANAKDTTHIALESIVADLICNPFARDALNEYELKSATEALAESLGVRYSDLDAESKRAAERRRAQMKPRRTKKTGVCR